MRDIHYFGEAQFSVAVPEPGGYVLLLSGGMALGLVGRRRKAAITA